jgi:hypothetical protein
VIGTDTYFSSRLEQLAALSVRHAVPTVYHFREFAAAGGLIAYGGSLADAFRGTGVSSSSKMLQIGEQSEATAGSGGETQIGLVAGADSRLAEENKDIVSIRQRPATVEDRAVPGHWEGDLLSGPDNSYIATLVERHTRYVMLAKVAGKDTRTVVSALITQAKKLPEELYKSLTWDRGKELTDHHRFTLATKIDVYFCDP